MIEFLQIKALALQIAEQFHPNKIILYGSYAYGSPANTSDIDLLVIMPFEGRQSEKAWEIQCSLPRSQPYQLDVRVRSPEEMIWRYHYGDPMIQDAIDRGIVLFETTLPC